MASNKKRVPTGFISFDVFYEDGSRSSNRRVPNAVLGGLDGDEPAMAVIEAQDAEISRASGRQRPAIKSIARSER